MKKVSIKTIAQELNVSTATVSMVLSNKDFSGRVSKELSDRIFTKAKELNYIPNNFAKNLREGRSKTLGLIVADISNVFFGTLALHIQECAELKDYTVIIGNTNEKVKMLKDMIDTFVRRQVDGFIITPTEGSEMLINELVEKKIPLVLVDRSFPKVKSCNVLIDNFEISYKATQMLISKECKRIAFVSYKSGQFHMKERMRGYVEALNESGIFNEDLIKFVEYEKIETDVFDAISDLMKDENNIDAIFLATNTISLNAMKCITKISNVKFSNLKIMCFDENEFYYFAPFDIPYIKQPIEEMGKIAVNLVTEQIDNSVINNMQYTLSAKIIDNRK